MADEVTTDDESSTTPTVTPEVNTPTLLDSINEALAPTLPKTDEAADTTGGEGEEDEADEEGEDGEEDGEGAESDAERNPDGTFKAKPKGEAAEGADKPKLGADGKPVVDDKAGAKKTDPVNDPIPEEIKGRTRERMQSLIGTVKEQGEMIAVQNQLFDSIKSTGASPEEFGAMLGYMRWVHSEKPEDLKQARTLLLNELEGISLKLGEAAPGIDFLSKFPDLQEKVNNGQITVEDANEMALHRQRTKVQTDQTAARQTQEQTAQAATAERNGAIAELNTLGATLMASDPDYARKHEALKPVIEALGTLPPKQWKGAFLSAYKALKLPPAGGNTGATPAGGAKPSNQPLRANKSPSGGQDRQPTSMLDVVNAAIEAAG